MRFLTSIIVTALALVLAPLASAQETGTLITKKAAQIEGTSPTDARRAAEDFGACIVQREKGRLAKIIELPVDSKEHSKLFEALFEGEDQCIGEGKLRMNELILRGAMFQALYKRDFSENVAISFPADLQTGYRNLYTPDLSDKARMFLSLENFGECVSRADPANVHLLILSRVGSATETQAFSQLMPRFSACIVKDNEITFSKSNLRGSLAEGMYRLARAKALKEGEK